MKKVLAIFTAICLLASLVAISASAEDTMSMIEISVVGDVSTVYADDDTSEVEFNINAVGMANNEIYGFEYLITYDSTVFEPVFTNTAVPTDVGQKDADLPADWTHGLTMIADGQLKFLSFNASDDVRAVDGVVATFKLKLKKKLAVDDTTAVKVVIEDGTGSVSEDEVNLDTRTPEADGTVQTITLTAVAKTAGLRGDLDGDDMVNISDVVKMRDWIMAGNATAAQIELADLDGDTTINISDIVILRDIIMGVA